MGVILTTYPSPGMTLQEASTLFSRPSIQCPFWGGSSTPICFPGVWSGDRKINGKSPSHCRGFIYTPIAGFLWTPEYAGEMTSLNIDRKKVPGTLENCLLILDHLGRLISLNKKRAIFSFEIT